jgi:hypothetical protein
MEPQYKYGICDKALVYKILRLVKMSKKLFPSHLILSKNRYMGQKIDEKVRNSKSLNNIPQYTKMF